MMGKTIWEIWLLFKHDGKGHFHHGFAHYPDGSCKELTVHRPNTPRPGKSVVSDGAFMVVWHDFCHEIQVCSWDSAVDELVFKTEEDFPYEIYPNRYVRLGEDVRLERTEKYDLPEFRHYHFLMETPWVDYPEYRQQCPEALQNRAIWEIRLAPDDSGHFKEGVAFYPDGSKLELTAQHAAPGQTTVTDGRYAIVWRDIIGEKAIIDDDLVYLGCEVDIQSWPEEIVEVIFHCSVFHSFDITGYQTRFWWTTEYIKRRRFYENRN